MSWEAKCDKGTTLAQTPFHIKGESLETSLKGLHPCPHQHKEHNKAAAQPGHEINGETAETEVALKPDLHEIATPKGGKRCSNEDKAATLE